MFRKIIAMLILVCLLTGVFVPQSVYEIAQANQPNYEVWLTQDNEYGNKTDKISAFIRVYNVGNQTINLSKIRIRYYFNLDADPSKVKLVATIVQGKLYNQEPHDEAVLNNMPYTFVHRGENSPPGADTYIEIGFPNSYNIKAKSNPKSYVEIKFEIIKQTNYDDSKWFYQDGHYSYNPDNWTEWPYTIVYEDDDIIWKIPPSGGNLPAPINLTARYGNGLVKLDWTAAPGAQSYEVYRSDSINGTYTKIAENVQNVSYNDNPTTTDPNGKRYYYKVAAVSTGGRSPYSNVASVLIYPCVNTALGQFTYYIKNNTTKPKQDYVLGSYVPIVAELKLGSKSKDPDFRVIKDLKNTSDTASPFTAAILPNYTKKLFVNSVLINNPSITAGQNNDFRINGTFNANDVIRLEFAVKISSKNNTGIVQYYGKQYKMNLGVSGYIYTSGKWTLKSMDSDNSGKPFSLIMKILNPNKLN